MIVKGRHLSVRSKLPSHHPSCNYISRLFTLFHPKVGFSSSQNYHYTITVSFPSSHPVPLCFEQCFPSYPSRITHHFCNTSSIPIRLLFRGDCNLLLSLSSSLSEVRRRVPIVDVGVGSWSGGMLDGPGGAIACEGDGAIGGSRRTSRGGADPSPGGAGCVPGCAAAIPGGPYDAV